MAHGVSLESEDRYPEVTEYTRHWIREQLKEGRTLADIAVELKTTSSHAGNILRHKVGAGPKIFAVMANVLADGSWDKLNELARDHVRRVGYVTSVPNTLKNREGFDLALAEARGRLPMITEDIWKAVGEYSAPLHKVTAEALMQFAMIAMADRGNRQMADSAVLKAAPRVRTIAQADPPKKGKKP